MNIAQYPITQYQYRSNPTCVCVFAVVVYLALYGIYVLVVVFGRIVYQYQKRKTAQNHQQRSVNRVDTDSDDVSKSFLYSRIVLLRRWRLRELGRGDIRGRLD